jgi:hypothetical protein
MSTCELNDLAGAGTVFSDGCDDDLVVRRSKPASSGSMRVNSSGLPHLEQGGQSLSTNL